MTRLAYNDPRHGTYNGYINLGCRCDACRKATTAMLRQLRAARVEKGLPPGDPRHGLVSSYGNWGCRCAACTAANTVDKRERRQRRAS